MKFNLLFIINLALIIFSSCGDPDAKQIQKIMQTESTVSPQNINYDNATIKQYIDIENQYTQKYIDTLTYIINHKFETQLSNFQANELGFFKSYGYMFKSIFQSDQKWNDELKVKSNYYFNNLNIDQEANKLFLAYQNEIKALRCHFITENKHMPLPTYEKLNLPQSNISMASLKDHSKNNLMIEIGTDLLGWLLVLFITWIVSQCLNAIPGIGCIINIIVTILIIIISIILSCQNDKKTCNSLREQHIELIEINYPQIQYSLNQNTILFYENIH